MADYSGDVTLALDMITERGITVTLRRVTEGTYNPVTDATTGSTVQTMVVAGVFLPLISRTELRDQFMLSGTSLINDHSKLLIPTKDTSNTNLLFVPRVGDVVVFGTLGNPNSQWWTVESCGPLEPDRTPILYTLILKKGAGTLAA